MTGGPYQARQHCQSSSAAGAVSCTSSQFAKKVLASTTHSVCVTVTAQEAGLCLSAAVAEATLFRGQVIRPQLTPYKVAAATAADRHRATSCAVTVKCTLCCVLGGVWRRCGAVLRAVLASAACPAGLRSSSCRKRCRLITIMRTLTWMRPHTGSMRSMSA